MELMGNLKDKVSRAQSEDEARGLIENAGMRLSKDELEQVVGGKTVPPASIESGHNVGGFNNRTPRPFEEALRTGDGIVH